MTGEILPGVIGAASGYFAAGLPLEWRAQILAAKEQAPIATALHKTAGTSMQPTEISSASRVRNVINRRGISFIAGLASATGAFTGLAIAQSHPTQTARPTLEIVVDHSGGAGVSGVATQINQLAGEFNDAAFNTRYIDNSMGDHSAVTYDQLVADVAIGDADLASATSSALNDVATILPVSDGKIMKRNAAVVVLTNGNTIGSPKDVISHASKPIRTPVFVVNVEGTSNSQTVTELEKIAKGTGARYWSADSRNLKDVRNDVKDVVTAYEKPDRAGHDQMIFDATMAAFSGLMTLVAYRRRRHMPINRGLK